MSLSICETLSMDIISHFERTEKILRTDYSALCVRRRSDDGSCRYLYAAGNNPGCLAVHLYELRFPGVHTILIEP